MTIERSVKFELVRAVENGDGLTLDGYAAVWDTPTEIDSWEGCFTESMQRGAFKKTIRESTPVMQFDHGRHPMIGSIPIGAIDTLEEDDRGLHVTARLSDNWLMQPVRDAIQDGSVNGMSFRFEVVRESWVDNAGVRVKPEELNMLMYNPGDRGPLARTLIEVKCHELGPVVFPAYKETTVSVRSRDIARSIEDDPSMRHELLADLMSDNARKPKVSGQQGWNARDVAIALLFGDDVRDSAPLATEEHPQVTDDAPLTSEHPSEESTTHLRPEHIQRRGQIFAARYAIALKGSERYGD